jgi:ElaB/YqjD/DUF883 family membrane-anchored ribosome-binding protein
MNDGTMTKSHLASAPHDGASNEKTSTLYTAKDLASEGSDKLEVVKERLLDVKNKVIEAKHKVVMRGNVMVEKTRTFVSARPLTAIAIAFGVGYIGMRVTRLFR